MTFEQAEGRGKLGRLPPQGLLTADSPAGYGPKG